MCSTEKALAVSFPLSPAGSSHLHFIILPRRICILCICSERSGQSPAKVSLCHCWAPDTWIQEQGAKVPLPSPGCGSWWVPAQGASQERLHCMHCMMVLSPDVWLLQYPPGHRAAREAGIHGCHITLLCHTSSCVGFAPGQGVRARNGLTAPQSKDQLCCGRFVVYLMHTLDPGIFFIFVADLWATWVANSPYMRMAMNCFNFQADSGSTWWQEKLITKPSQEVIQMYSRYITYQYLPKNLIISMIFCNIVARWRIPKALTCHRNLHMFCKKTSKFPFIIHNHESKRDYCDHLAWHRLGIQFQKTPELLSKSISLRKASTSLLKISTAGEFTIVLEKLFQQLK